MRKNSPTKIEILTVIDTVSAITVNSAPVRFEMWAVTFVNKNLIWFRGIGLCLGRVTVVQCAIFWRRIVGAPFKIGCIYYRIITAMGRSPNSLRYDLSSTKAP